MDSPIQHMRSFINHLEQFLDRNAKEYGMEHLAGPQGHLVMYLYKHPSDSFSIKDVETVLRISKSVASNLVKRMEKNGFISIQPSEKDKRVKHIFLTELGNEKAKVFEEFLEHTHKIMMADISDDDIKTAVRVIKTLAKNIHFDLSEDSHKLPKTKKE